MANNTKQITTDSIIGDLSDNLLPKFVQLMRSKQKRGLPGN